MHNFFIYFLCIFFSTLSWVLVLSYHLYTHTVLFATYLAPPLPAHIHTHTLGSRFSLVLSHGFGSLPLLFGSISIYTVYLSRSHTTTFPRTRTLLPTCFLFACCTTTASFSIFGWFLLTYLPPTISSFALRDFLFVLVGSLFHIFVVG